MALKKRADGRYVRVIKDERTGKRVYFYGTSEREINKKIFDYQTRSERGRLFAEIAGEWWSLKHDSYASQSLKAFKPAYERALSEFGETPIKEIIPRDISAFLKKLAQFYKLSKKTIANQRTILNQIFEYAILENDIMYNPCTSVPLPNAKAGEHRSAASRQDEETVKNTPDIWLFPFIALYTGMRKGEILALQWGDIDFDKSIIYVTKSVYHQGDRAYIKAPKTKESIRAVPLLAPLREQLISLRAKDDKYVISDDGTKPLTNRRYLTLFKRYKEQTGIMCTAHQLRHSFATIAIENGVPMKSVQEILGHQQLSTTLDIYTDFREKALRDAQTSLENAFKNTNY